MSTPPYTHVEGRTVVAGPLVEWTWYCRICGVTAVEFTECDRDAAALNHVDTDCTCAGRPTLATAGYGHLLHIWRY